MRDYEARPAAHHLIEGRLNERFVLGVERARGFVQNEDARIFEQHARDREPLAFAAGELVAALAHDRRIALGQRRDEVVYVRPHALPLRLRPRTPRPPPRKPPRGPRRASSAPTSTSATRSASWSRSTARPISSRATKASAPS